MPYTSLCVRLPSWTSPLPHSSRVCFCKCSSYVLPAVSAMNMAHDFAPRRHVTISRDSVGCHNWRQAAIGTRWIRPGMPIKVPKAQQRINYLPPRRRCLLCGIPPGDATACHSRRWGHRQSPNGKTCEQPTTFPNYGLST